MTTKPDNRTDGGFVLRLPASDELISKMDNVEVREYVRRELEKELIRVSADLWEVIQREMSYDNPT